MVSKMSIKKRKFKKQDYHRYRKLKKGWRKPIGRQSKLRKGKSGNSPKPRIGYGSNRKTRGYVQGKKVLFVTNLSQLNIEKDEKIGVMISGKIGLKKFDEIIKKAQEIGLTILNPKKMKKVSKRAKLVERKKLEANKTKKKDKKESKKLSTDVKKEVPAETKDEVKEEKKEEK